MDYLVSVEAIDQINWQTELLIESFYVKNQQDNLLIAVAESNSKLGYPTPNLTNHKRKFQHLNLGRNHGYPHLNKWYAAYIALKSGKIKFPFTIIDPDCVFINDIPLDVNHHIIYQHDNNRNLIEINDLIDTSEIKIGSIIQFNIVLEFFELMIYWVQELIKYQYSKNWTTEPFKICYDTDKIALALSMKKLSNFKYAQTYDYESSLLENRDACFIHYNLGIPPYFHKKNYQSKIQLAENPLNIINKYSTTLNTHRLQVLAWNYQKRHKEL